MKAKRLITILAALMLMAMAAPAQAALGHLEFLVDTTYTIDDSFDPVTGDNYMVGGGLRLEFDIAYGLSAGLDYTYADTSGNLFEDFSTAYKIHSPKIALRWRYQGIEWMEPYVLLMVGTEFHRLTIDNEYGRSMVDHRADFLPAVGGYGGLQFQLKESWLEKWKVWEGFSLGVFMEGGYLWRKSFEPELIVDPMARIDNALATSQSLGELNSSGPGFRVGIFWRF